MNSKTHSQVEKAQEAKWLTSRGLQQLKNPARNAEREKTGHTERFNPGSSFFLAEAAHLTGSGTLESTLSLPLGFVPPPPKPSADTYRVCELVSNELAHQGNGCGPFLPNLEERQTYETR